MTERYEQMLAFLSARLAAPVTQDQAPDGSTFFTSGEPAEVIVRLTRSSVTVWEFAVAWDAARTPVVTPIRAGSIVWRRLPEGSAETVVHALIEAARASRRARFQVCDYCGRTVPPEGLAEDRVCQRCAAVLPGIDH